MLAFKERPQFLDDYTVAGFRVSQLLGAPGELTLYLHAKKEVGRQLLEEHARLQGFVGTELSCSIEDWNFSGRIEGVEYGGSTSGFEIHARDALSGLEWQHGSRVFSDETLESICSELLSGLPYRLQGKLGQCHLPLAIQYQESTLGFLRRVVNACGGQVWCSGAEIVVGDCAGDPTVSLRLDRDVTDYSFDSGIGPEQVNARSVSYLDKNKVSVETLKLPGGPFGAVHDAALKAREGHSPDIALHVVQEDTRHAGAQHRAEAVLRSHASGRFSLQGTVRKPLPLGCAVNLSSPGATGSPEETVVITAVSGGSYSEDNEATWRIDACNPEALLAWTTLPEPRLLMSTAVVMNARDPHNMNRVTVSFLWDEKGVESPWLRVVSPYWGEGHSLYLPPKIGDTVSVLWRQWDTDPVVVGALSAGIEAPSPNETMTFKTTEGHTVTMDAESMIVRSETGGSTVEIRCGSGSVAVSTGHGHSVEIGENGLVLEHAGGGKIAIDQTSVRITSAGDLELTNGQGAKIKLSGPMVSVNDGALEVV